MHIVEQTIEPNKQEHLEKENKYLIQVFDPETLPVAWTESYIVQEYLLSPKKGTECRVRARTDEKGTKYYHTVKTEVRPGVRAEQESVISADECARHLIFRDPDKVTVKKRRIYFYWKGQRFEADLFQEPLSGLAIMEAERDDIRAPLELPPFIEVIREVTDDKNYSNSELARKKPKSSNP